MKICNKSKRYKSDPEICQHHEDRCPHFNWHSTMTIECNPSYRLTAGLPEHCRWYPDQKCVDFDFKEVKE
jgi:hypothetical protein